MTTLGQETIPSTDVAYRNFVGACSRYLYKKALEYFLSYLRLGSQDYVKLLDMDRQITQINICNYISYLRDQKGLA
jgi:hypothetical protein